jgi:AcrR family transcriptional regulator
MARMGRDEQILEAAEQLIYERGFDGVGVDAIGQLAGVSGSAIYRHFDGKDEILGVLFDKAIDALLVRIQAADPDPAAELTALVRAHVEFAGSHPRLAAIWLREERSLADPYRRPTADVNSGTSNAGGTAWVVVFPKRA